MENIAFIIGNGKSRESLELNTLRGAGTIFGCNALYRDFEPDFLVAIDDGIITEVYNSGFSKDKILIPPLDERWEPEECNPNRPRSNAGINAMREAIKKGFTDLVCFGFDFIIQDKDQSISNIYDGTSNYGPGTRASFWDNPGRMRYLNWTIQKIQVRVLYLSFQKTVKFGCLN